MFKILAVICIISVFLAQASPVELAEDNNVIVPVVAVVQPEESAGQDLELAESAYPGGYGRRGFGGGGYGRRGGFGGGGYPGGGGGFGGGFGGASAQASASASSYGGGFGGGYGRK